MSKQKVTVTFELNDDVAQNDLKNWVKSCPHSPEGGQTLKFEAVESAEAGESSAEGRGLNPDVSPSV